MIRRVLGGLLGIVAVLLVVQGVYTLAVADDPGYENATTYGGLALIAGLVAALLAWAAFRRDRS